MQRYKELQDIIAILGLTSWILPIGRRVRWARKIQRFFSQLFHVTEEMTGYEGRYVKIEDTLNSFEAILGGELDDIPEQAFFMKGSVDEAYAAKDEG